MAAFGYEYFCGANVVLTIEGMPILECVGLSMSISESKRPIYGYSSRHYDAKANGQVLVEGSLLINYVDQNYLFKALEKGLQDSNQFIGGAPPPAIDLSNELRESLYLEGNAQTLLNQYILDPVSNSAVPKVLASLWYSNTTPGTSEVILNPFDSYAGFDAKVTFGDREPYNFYQGLTNFTIQDLTFVGRGLSIQISEEVIVEQHSFFARNLVHIKDNRVLNSTSVNGEQVTTIQN